ncbi:hypothetical protein D3C73_1336300 [compost metagenome]
MKAASRPAAVSVAAEARTIFTRPILSTSDPVIKDGKYMAATCSPITIPTAVNVLPWCSIWTGVMVMIATITICESTSTIAPVMIPNRCASGWEACLDSL